jgi:hypothetical protein
MMNRQCLICESKAVLTQDAARGLTLLIGLAGGALRSARKATDEDGNAALIRGLAAIVPSYPAAMAAAEDVARFHFSGFDCLCLRCGALFDESALVSEGLSPG